MASITIRRGFADTPRGQIHYAEAGEGEPVLFLHQTPRSWTEYEWVLPIVGEGFRAIAMDTPGFGDSYRPREEAAIEVYASGVNDFLNAMALSRVSLVGHHTGGVVAVEVAASYPERVHKLILSSCPYVDQVDREKRKTRPPIDEVSFSADGSHLLELWNRRLAFYPKDRPDLISRFVLDALKVADHMEEGHRAVNAYRMEEKTPLIKAPTLVLAGTGDPFSHPRMGPLSQAIPGCITAEIEGGMVPMPEQMPESFSSAVVDFLK